MEGYQIGTEEMLSITRKAMVRERQDDFHAMSKKELAELFVITVDLFGWHEALEFFEREGLTI
jgi:hypothetical protein